MNYKNYQSARNAAWNILLNCKIDRLPVDLNLGHVSPGTVTTANREPSPHDNPQETAANQFAARLLAPVCVLWGLDLHTPEEIARACHISMQSAEFRASRMDVLYARNRFLLSLLERRMYQQLLSFIKE